MARIESFGFPKGKILNRRYEISEKLGEGWEGEVYLVREISTGIERAAKFFYPHRNKNNKASKFYAKKLFKLNDCDILIQYHFQDTLKVKKQEVTYLISEFIEGELLSEFVERHHGKKLDHYVALHILYSIVKGLEDIHRHGEYHGDLHTDNIVVDMKGMGFNVKLIDLYNFGTSNASLRKDDIVDLIGIFYEIMGGRKSYSRLPDEIKHICCGLKRSLILKRFPSITKLREHLEDMEWE